MEIQETGADPEDQQTPPEEVEEGAEAESLDHLHIEWAGYI